MCDGRVWFRDVSDDAFGMSGREKQACKLV